ncbi:tetratricopeptide repeat protein [Aporhodopirellula aestuarii]|uniref:Tetratricopeptide repeat protein n=1 Tax=Aporhodopirellula aestuarii TaxID=2950107 RepID=A0ABT0U4J5_9BACT|nr:tetratricopeptide repeat protein [Aporhodopirellula aestuarii]MCM2371840.1 tetratricopeptide repeat protein [Aporhodopirellula aestuarii]
MDDTRISQQDRRSNRTDRSVASRRAVRRQLFAVMVIGSTVSLTSAGCAGRSMSLASMNPFKAKSSETSITETPGKLVSTTSKVASDTVSASKSMASKTTGTIASWFGRGDDDTSDQDDPLSLDTQPEKLEPDVFVANGQLWESTGNLTKAMESYAKALETDPNNGPALTSIARLHFRESNYPQSAEYFQKAIAQTPNDAALYNDLGLTLSKLGQHEIAAKTLQRALELAPGTSRYANNLASVHFESGKTDEALKVLTANNKPAVAHFNMAFLHYKKGQTAQAQAQLKQSLAHEQEASSDPATKRAIDRSREMLAQLNPGGALPARRQAMPEGTPAEIGPAAGPSAIIAAAPAHRANQSPQILGQVSPQGVAPESMTPVSYQDPRSYMSPQVPAGATPGATTTPTSSPQASTGQSPPAATTPAPAATNPQDPPSQSGFMLPGGFTLPNMQ